MKKAYEVTVTYKLYALNEVYATGQVLNSRVEPETLIVSDLPIEEQQMHPHPEKSLW